ncbi:MAG: hypothetical protein HQL88_11090 [Magnetococcales bacterium]|nr:hypothetical protein [Magnetococcales bacterium]
MRYPSALQQIQACFSRVELAILCVIIGLLAGAEWASRQAGERAAVRAAYQSVVVPCVAAVQEALRQDARTAEVTHPDVRLGDLPLHCRFSSSMEGVINQVTVVGAPPALQALMRQSLADGVRVTVEGNRVTLATPTALKSGRQ